jgi:hypothetical protein
MTKEGRYERLARPALQKLLYLNPDPPVKPLCEMSPLRDVESYWCEESARYAAQGVETGRDELRGCLDFYAPVSARIRHALSDLQGTAV